MPFGLCNALATLMCLLNNVFCPSLDSFMILFLDDILVFISTYKKNISHPMQVLETLKNHQLLANLKKCEFSQQSLVHMWYIIGGDELKIYLVNMAVIIKWEIHTNDIEFKNFVGETSTYKSL